MEKDSNFSCQVFDDDRRDLLENDLELVPRLADLGRAAPLKLGVVLRNVVGARGGFRQVIPCALDFVQLREGGECLFATERVDQQFRILD